MKAKITWTEKMQFEAEAGGNTLKMDAKSPIGQGSAMTPKELVAAGLAGCSAMDVIAYLKKHKQGHQSLDIAVDIETSKGEAPVVFTKATLTFHATGEIDKNILLESIHLSQTKYCGVSAMLIKAFPIHYKVILNGHPVGEGAARFD